jgi:hypothetical protein
MLRIYQALYAHRLYMSRFNPYERRIMMSDKKSKSKGAGKKVKLSVSNDQLGENAGEGRFEKAINSKSGKCR